MYIPGYWVAFEDWAMLLGVARGSPLWIMMVDHFMDRIRSVPASWKRVLNFEYQLFVPIEKLPFVERHGYAKDLVPAL